MGGIPPGGGRRGSDSSPPTGDEKEKVDTDPFSHVDFESVRGLDDQKNWIINNIVDAMNDPQQQELWGIPMPKGVLFHGPPGTGKTLLARAFGNEVSKLTGKKVEFYHRTGGELSSKWFGESARLIKALFTEAEQKAPAIIFLDELDGFCGSRNDRSSQARIGVVTSLLGQMDTLTPGKVFVFGATNRIDSIDPAMRRPGRFDKELQFFLPSLEARKEILTLHSKMWKRSHPEGELLDTVAQKTVGYCGADLENLCRETFHAAFARHVPNLDDEPEGGIGSMEIKLEDWMVALKVRNSSGNSSFGSAIYIPKMPSVELNPLLVRMQKEIIDEVTQVFPKEEVTASTSLEKDKISKSPAEVATFYFWNDSPYSGDFALESLILPGVFAHEILGDVPIFILNKETILSKYSSHRVTTIANVIMQAASSAKRCIIYIPQLEGMVRVLDNDTFDLYDQLIHLRGKHVLLVATGSVQPNQISDPLLRSLFTRTTQKSYKIPTISATERRNYFQPIFADLQKINPTISLDVALESTVTRSEGDPIETLASLTDQLYVTMHKTKDSQDDVLGQINKLLVHYSKTRFRF
ncbi:ATPase family AAA domain-containing protein 2 [Folsomia candida]|nr:ATPase family AAA domain-containing protein 2 [Folsomia candida]